MPYPTGHRSTPRLEALKAGSYTYEGGPCKHCGMTKRYTKQASCVMCNKRRSTIANLDRLGKPVPPEVADPVLFATMKKIADASPDRKWARRRFLSGLK